MLILRIHSQNILPLVDSFARYVRHVNNNDTKYDTLPRSSFFCHERQPLENYFSFRRVNFEKDFSFVSTFESIFISTQGTR